MVTVNRMNIYKRIVYTVNMNFLSKKFQVYSFLSNDSFVVENRLLCPFVVKTKRKRFRFGTKTETVTLKALLFQPCFKDAYFGPTCLIQKKLFGLKKGLSNTQLWPLCS